MRKVSWAALVVVMSLMRGAAADEAVGSRESAGAGTVAGRLEAVERELAKLKEGVTTREDVVRAFGAPDQSLTLEGGREIFTYVYERKINSSLTVLLLVSSHTNTSERTRFSFEFQDGLLVNYWEQDMS